VDTNRLALEGGPMSRGQPGSSSEPMLVGSHLVGAPGGGSPRNEPRAEDPVATIE
ncbi:unnamed protein product, partial [Musa textilis]